MMVAEMTATRDIGVDATPFLEALKEFGELVALSVAGLDDPDIAMFELLLGSVPGESRLILHPGPRLEQLLIQLREARAVRERMLARGI